MKRLLTLLGAVLVVGIAALVWWAQRPCTSKDCAPALAIAATATRTPPSATPSRTPTATSAPTATGTPQVIPFGAVQTEDGGFGTPTPRPRFVTEAELVELHGDTAYASLDAMPSDLAFFVGRTLDDVAEYFVVPQEALLELLAARNGGQLRLVQRDASGEFSGAASLSPRLWNGWAAPLHDEYLTSLRAIDQYGGLGFDWSARYTWQNWRTNNSLAYFQYTFASQADPVSFENNVAALARYLLQEGLTQAAAREDPDQFERALASAIVNFPETAIGIRPLAAPLSAPPAAEAVAPIRNAFQEEMARRFGVRLSEQDQAALVDARLSGAASEQPAYEVAAQLVTTFIEQQTLAALQAQAEERPLPWPFLLSEAHLQVQEQAVALLGHTLAAWEIQLLLDQTGGEPSALDEALTSSQEAELYTQSYEIIDQGLQRSSRGLPLYNYEVTALLQPALNDVQAQGRNWRTTRQSALTIGTVEKRLRRSAEFRDLNGDLFFEALPYDPMPAWVLQPYGVPASYQPEGYHTGLDLRGDRFASQQPLIHAVDDGTVVHVGPLYCLQEGACRGPYAVVIHHGNNIYTTYSHNSEAHVQPGEQVQAGQVIARQGSEGYSRGPHLHLEVHVGAPWSGNWADPWLGGRFVDPWPWLPELPDQGTP